MPEKMFPKKKIIWIPIKPGRVRIYLIPWMASLKNPSSDKSIVSAGVGGICTNNKAPIENTKEIRLIARKPPNPNEAYRRPTSNGPKISGVSYNKDNIPLARTYSRRGTRIVITDEYVGRRNAYPIP